MVVVMQRFHEEDLVGHLLLQCSLPELRLTLVAEQAQQVTLGSGRVQHLAAGTSIFHTHPFRRGRGDQHRRAVVYVLSASRIPTLQRAPSFALGASA